MSVTNVWKDTKKGEYAVLTRKVLKIKGKEVKLDFHFIGESGKEECLEPVAKYRNLGPPLSQFGNPMYLSQEDLLKALSASGVKPEEIEKLRKRMSYTSGRM